MTAFTYLRSADLLASASRLPLALPRRNRARCPRVVGEVTNTEWENDMNWDRVEGEWKQWKGKVQQQWGKLTNDDLDVIEGNRTELSGRLQQRYGYAKDQAEKEIDTWMKAIH